MIKKMILSLMLSLMLVALPAMAAQNPTAVLNVDNALIDLSWDVSGVYDKQITVSVADNATPLSDSNLPDYAWVDSKPSDTFNKKIKLSPIMESGLYRVYIDTASEHHSLDLYIMNIKSTETINICNDAYTVSNVQSFAYSAAAWAPHLGFELSDEFVSDNFDAAIVPLFYEMSRHSEKNPLAVYYSSRASLAYAALKNGYDAKKIVADYAADLGADSIAFSKITDKVKNKFTHYIAKTDNNTKSIANVIDETLLLASLTGAKDWNTLKEITLANADAINIDISSDSQYSKIRNSKQYKVFVKLYESLDDVENLEDFSQKFNSAVSDVRDELGDNSSSGGGSSSSGGGSIPAKTTVGESFINQSATQYPSVKTFKDLSGHFSESYVNELVALGAINGYEDGSFRPDSSVTRAEFVAIAQRALSITASADAVSFNDVNSGEWYYGAVSAASSNGIISGYNGLFRPNDHITRQDAALILANLMKYRGVTASETQLTYSDASSISDYAFSAVAKMASVGIMQGSDGLFRPVDSITRGETATVIARLIKISEMVSEVND